MFNMYFTSHNVKHYIMKENMGKIFHYETRLLLNSHMKSEQMMLKVFTVSSYPREKYKNISIMNTLVALMQKD